MSSDGFKHVRPNRGPHKRSGKFFATQLHAGNNGRHPSERVKWIKATVMSKKRSPVFQEKINRGDTAELTADRRWCPKQLASFYFRKIGSATPGEGPTHFLNRALLRLNSALFIFLIPVVRPTLRWLSLAFQYTSLNLRASYLPSYYMTRRVTNTITFNQFIKRAMSEQDVQGT